MEYIHFTENSQGVSAISKLIASRHDPGRSQILPTAPNIDSFANTLKSLLIQGVGGTNRIDLKCFLYKFTVTCYFLNSTLWN